MDSINAEKSPGFIGLMNTTKVKDDGVFDNGYTFDNRQVRQNEKGWTDFLNDFTNFMWTSYKFNIYEHRMCEIDGTNILNYIKKHYYTKNKCTRENYNKIANDIISSTKDNFWESDW